MLDDAFHEETAMRQKELLRIIKEQQNSKLMKRWVHDFISRHLDQLQVCHPLPQEDMRIAVPRAYLEEHIHLLKTHITGKVADLVFNLDELDSADWDDRKAKKGITPDGLAQEDVSHAVSRRHRQMTLLAYVSAAGDALTP
jgi:hypothetical protein